MRILLFDRISCKHWAGALMEVRSVLRMNSAVKKKHMTDGPTNQQTNRRTDQRTGPNIESLVQDERERDRQTETYCRGKKLQR